MIKIVVDTLGGDNSPYANVEGAIKALNKIDDLFIILSGDEPVLEKVLQNYSYDKSRLSILHAPDVIDCNEKPTVAIKTKKESSMVKAMDLLKSDDEINALVSIGSSGALLTGAVLKIGRIAGVKRPAFCPLMPTVKGGFCGVCDSGANVDCDASQLVQFALMGNLYMQKTYNIEHPRIALLNVGTEEEKGDALRKEVFQALKNIPSLNFVGNMEGRDLLKGDYDLVVCDGFSGNVLIKSTEGACLEVLKLMKGALTKNFKTKMGALLVKKEVGKIKASMDYNNYGGAVFLGAKKTIVKGHGSSKSESIFHCVEQAYNMEKSNLRQAIEEGLKNVSL